MPDAPDLPLKPSIAILIPIFDDWEASALLCRQLDRACVGVKNAAVDAYLVDDGSSNAPMPGAFTWPLASLGSITTLRLRRNVGHQRAIALGLAYLYDRTAFSAVLVMDGDGEDKPSDAVALIERHLADPSKIIFASRRRRLEGRLFQMAYALYRLCHFVLTGLPVRIGNFSIVSRQMVGAIVVSTEAWSHYAAAVVKARLPMTTVPMDRGARMAGRSTMNYVRLVTHGLSAISVFRELVGTRLLIAAAAATTAGIVTLVVLLAFMSTGRLMFDQQTAILTALVALLTLQALTASLTLAFSILAGRDQSAFLPIRDYHYFLDSTVVLNGR
jgi:polyisoprenyl-phosphate glycosyltransferase